MPNRIYLTREESYYVSAVSYPLFLTALLVLATGITGLQVSANPYVNLLGKPETHRAGWI